MDNTIEIRTDGVNVYALLEIKANTVGKVIVIYMLLFGIAVLALILSTIKE